MLLYRAIKPIRKGDELLAWYSSKVQQELITPANDFKNELIENGNYFSSKYQFLNEISHLSN
jgi:hypothetical protein